MTFMATRLCLAYITFPFVLLELRHAWTIYKYEGSRLLPDKAFFRAYSGHSFTLHVGKICLSGIGLEKRLVRKQPGLLVPCLLSLCSLPVASLISPVVIAKILLDRSLYFWYHIVALAAVLALPYFVQREPKSAAKVESVADGEVMSDIAADALITKGLRKDATAPFAAATPVTG